MRALLVDHDSPNHLRLGERPDPEPARDEVLVRVVSSSLNRGEVLRAARSEPGSVLGWDALGVVTQAARDGSGPAPGAQVLTVAPDGGGWAEYRAVSTRLLAEIRSTEIVPDLAALPVAGLSALRSLRMLGLITGHRILVTGASGGFGRMTVQLGKMSGARVVAVAEPQHHEALRRLGAADMVTRPSQVETVVSAAIDTVGGDWLVECYRAVADHGGTVVSVGHAAVEDARFPVEAMRARSRSIFGFYLFADLNGIPEDLAWLAGQVAAGRLDPQVTWRGSWADTDDAVEAMLGRRLHGKAVLEIG